MHQQAEDKPQNAEPTPISVTPETVTASVPAAANRSFSAASAAPMAPAIEPSRAVPATVASNAGGSAREQADQRGAEQRDQAPPQGVEDAGLPALAGIGMRLGAGAERGRDRREVGGVRPQESRARARPRR